MATKSRKKKTLIRRKCSILASEEAGSTGKKTTGIETLRKDEMELVRLYKD